MGDDLENPDDHADEEAGLAVVGPEGLLVPRGLDVSDAKRPKALEKIFTMTRAPNFAFHLWKLPLEIPCWPPSLGANPLAGETYAAYKENVALERDQFRLKHIRRS